ncbi:MAG: hypothetical protein ACRD9W_06630, partial [Terriglobia bacterium]
MTAFQIAVRSRDRHELPVNVALGFSLQAADKKIGIDLKTKDELTARLNWTPPSLYLFEAGT